MIPVLLWALRSITATVWRVSGLQSMLVPLETLQGWPPAPNPSLLHLLGLVLGLPIVLALVIAGLSYVGSGSDLRRFGPAIHPVKTFADPVAVEGGTGAGPASIEAASGADTGTGGTSARW